MEFLPPDLRDTNLDLIAKRLVDDRYISYTDIAQLYASRAYLQTTPRNIDPFGEVTLVLPFVKVTPGTASDVIGFIRSHLDEIFTKRKTGVIATEPEGFLLAPIDAKLNETDFSNPIRYRQKAKIAAAFKGEFRDDLRDSNNYRSIAPFLASHWYQENDDLEFQRFSDGNYYTEFALLADPYSRSEIMRFAIRRSEAFLSDYEVLEPNDYLQVILNEIQREEDPQRKAALVRRYVNSALPKSPDLFNMPDQVRRRSILLTGGYESKYAGSIAVSVIPVDETVSAVAFDYFAPRTPSRCQIGKEKLLLATKEAQLPVQRITLLLPNEIVDALDALVDRPFIETDICAINDQIDAMKSDKSRRRKKANVRISSNGQDSDEEDSRKNRNRYLRKKYESLQRKLQIANSLDNPLLREYYENSIIYIGNLIREQARLLGLTVTDYSEDYLQGRPALPIVTSWELDVETK